VQVVQIFEFTSFITPSPALRDLPQGGENFVNKTGNTLEISLQLKASLNSKAALDNFLCGFFYINPIKK